MDLKGDSTHYRVPSPSVLNGLWGCGDLKCRRDRVGGSRSEHNEETKNGWISKRVEGSGSYGSRPEAGKELTYRFLAVED